MPDRPSSAVQSTVTSPLYQPAALGAVVAAPSSVGAVLSMLMPSTVADAVLPATSVAVPVTFWPAPSFLSVVVAGEQSAMPESASSQSNDTTTSLLFQPKPFAAGVREPSIVGLTRSILTSIECAFSTLPALSTDQNEIVCLPFRPWLNVPVYSCAAPPSTL